MNNKLNQPHYIEAKNAAIADILEELHKEGKVFLTYNARRTANINIIIDNNCNIEPDPIESYDTIY